ncbi:hypothetical protein MUK42_35164 [Musa troglodytarum]|uniref:Uncharacterized protein n=1 Tax=Musa troglodytarum TaxID=320322 RepID=A0A9E7GNK2_9LILI|nr:hypothetical protein MUK42_35164 [Musa troglodytarum]
MAAMAFSAPIGTARPAAFLGGQCRSEGDSTWFDGNLLHHSLVFASLSSSPLLFLTPKSEPLTFKSQALVPIQAIPRARRDLRYRFSVADWITGQSPTIPPGSVIDAIQVLGFLG